MTLRSLSSLFGRKRDAPAPVAAAETHTPAGSASHGPIQLDLTIAPNDPLLGYLQNTGSVADVQALNLDSPALAKLRAAGVQLVVPLVSQGELLGIISLGARRSDQEYSSDDRRLLADLASRAAPSVRVAQLVRQQQIETRQRERIESELRVARIIQETLLPKELPNLHGYALSAYWQPARAVGGDFYDFFQFEDGKLAIIVGDVTDKGVPAALVMSTTRTVLRAAAERFQSPGLVLQRANDILCPDMPPKMFVTCLYAVLDPATGAIRYANAGHDVPYLCTADGVEEMRATGMPLGLLPNMSYDEKEVTVMPGETVVLYSDGLVEAHNPAREMFSFRRLRELVGKHTGGSGMIPFLLDQLTAFVGEEWEQEDDVTIVTVQRLPESAANGEAAAPPRLLADFTVSSAPGNEREAMQRVARAVEHCGLAPAQISRLKTAVSEATMNAMEHGNHYNPLLSVALQVLSDEEAITVRITDHGGGRAIPTHTAPDLNAKLAGRQSPRGWGLFLIRNMVDKIETTTDEVHHTVQLVMLRHTPTTPAPGSPAPTQETGGPA